MCSQHLRCVNPQLEPPEKASHFPTLPAVVPVRRLLDGTLTRSIQLRSLLSIPDGQDVVFERFSDSAAAYVTLDPENVQVYKTLMRAAKAKLKLRIRATVASETNEGQTALATSHDEASMSAPEAPKPRPASLALPYGQLPSHRSVHSIPARQSLYELKSSTAEASNPLQTQLSGKATDVDGEEEAPVPRPFPARESKFLLKFVISYAFINAYRPFRRAGKHLQGA